MICSTRGFGAPVTDAGGNVARTQRAEPDVGAAPPAHRAHEMVRGRGGASTAHSAGTCDRARLAHAAEVVAGEVDDHHVLGAVLRARAQRRRVGAGSLDRPGLDVASVATRGSARATPTRRPPRGTPASPPNRRSARAAPGCTDRARRTGATGSTACSHVEPAGEVDLVAVAGADVLEDRRDTLLELGAVEARAPARARGRSRPRLHRRRAASTDCASRSRPSPCPCSSDRPDAESSTGGPGSGQNEVRERRFPVSAVRATTWLDPLDRAAEVVAEEARPPSGRQPVEHIQRVGA